MKEVYLSKIKSFINGLKFCFGISMKSSKRVFVYRVIIEVFYSLIPLFTIFINKELINLFVFYFNRNYNTQDHILYNFLILLCILAGLQIVSVILRNIKDVLAGIHKDIISNYVNIRISKKASSLDLSYYDSATFYNEVTNTRRDSQALQTLTWVVFEIIGASIQLISVIYILVKLNWIFAIILIFLSIPSVFTEKEFAKQIYSWERRRAPEERKMTYIINIMMRREFAKDLRLFRLQRNLIHRYISLWKKWFSEKKSILIKRGKLVTVFSLFPYIGLYLIMFYVGLNIINGKLTVGDFSLYNNIVSQTMMSIFLLINSFTKIYDNNLKIENYMNFFKWENSIINENIKHKADLKAKIEFINVSFKYPGTDQYILKNVSFCIKYPQRVALVGKNGAGKSTIIKLMLRFYEPCEGVILLDGIDIREYNKYDVRKCFSVLFQDFPNYAFTIKENITISNLHEKEDLNKIKEASKRSGANKIVEKYQDGYDTFLTREFEENGKELSGGEWQKIALARTFFRDGNIVILDEPSSALDPEAEHRMFEEFHNLFNDKGIIFISHRLANVTKVDKIIVLDNGRVAEDGTHEELMNINGLYAYLFNLQAEKYR